MMRFVWAVEGDDPDYGNCRANGITGIFAPMFDRLTDKMYLRRFIAEGFIPGLYVGHNWFPQLGPNELAAKVIAEYKRLTFASGEGDPALPNVRLMMNLEQHDPVFILSNLTQIRKALPKLGLSWSPEGMQGGWMSPDFVSKIVALKVRVVPQTFVGSMANLDDRGANPGKFYTDVRRSIRSENQIRDNLTDRGFPVSSISLFHDGAWLTSTAEGYVFTEGRLPRGAQ